MVIDTDKPYMDIELFPCAGGFAEGFRRAGVTFDMAVELLENHCDSYEANLGHRPIQMDARSLWEMLQMGWRPPKPVRMLVADPPCTPWSRAGKRMGTDDPRDMLEGTCQIITLLQPSVYLIGNVPGLDDGPNLPIVQRHIGSLSRLGYCTADYARLDAANYGVPQHRIRPFWFGHKEGPCIMWPRPTHGDPELVNGNLTLPGVDALIPWITCRDALGHLPIEELGRPIKQRKRTQNSKQHGSVPERPARVVGTSNLSDGNVILGDGQPRAGKRGKKSVAPPPLELQEGTPGKRKPYDKTKDTRVKQGNRTGNLDEPSPTLTAKPARKGAGAHSVVTLQPERGQTLADASAPAPTILRNTHGNGSILTGFVTVSDKHPAISADTPATTIRGGGEGHSAPPVVLTFDEHHPPTRGFDQPANTVRAGSGGGATRAIAINGKHPPADADKPAPTLGAKQRGQAANVIATNSKHPASNADAPSITIRASDGEGANRAMAWPWDRPSTTVLADERLGPPGHHSEDYSIMSVDGDGIVISEKAAAILQGFPETWVFVGESKKKRWSQIGQAMPPPLAHAVAQSVVEQIAKSERDHLRAAGSAT